MPIPTNLFTKVGKNDYLYRCTPEARAAGVSCLAGPIGFIFSRFHFEKILRKHESLVTVRMNDNYLESVRNADKVERGAIKVPVAYILCGFLHDIGKKWVGQTNKDGEISSYGHAQCSAYVANQWLKKTQLVDSRTRKVIVAAIYGHDLIKKWNPDGPKKVEEYQELLREIFDDDEDNTLIRKLTEAIADADAGVTAIVVDNSKEEAEYELSWEHFSKIDGEIEEKTEMVPYSKYNTLLERGEEIIKKTLPC